MPWFMSLNPITAQRNQNWYEHPAGAELHHTAAGEVSLAF